MTKYTCTEDGCNRPARAARLCYRHYYANKTTTCYEPGCESPVNARGLCNAHYLKRRHSGELALLPRRTPFDRFIEKVDKTDDCWLWTGALAGKGYGYLGIDGKNTYAHRFSYEHFVGPIPPGMQIDHLCQVTRCVNPEHLQVVTCQENLRRRPVAVERDSRETCANGHLWTEETTYLRPNGSRECRVCMRERDAKRRPPRGKKREAAKCGNEIT